LRLVNNRIQTINRGCQVNNNTGVTGVCYDRSLKGYVATWKDADGNLCKKYFSLNKYSFAESKAMAIEYCQRMIRSLPLYVEALRLNVDNQ